MKPAVYVNQWRCVSIRAGKPEGWMCGFFFNDGSLTGDTILRQFDHVVMCCESINARIYGVVLDAGGGNSKFASRLRGNKRFSSTTTWLLEQLCFTYNIYDPHRRIYVWFCLTHMLKAMRNQLLASQQGGSKFFLDEYGIPFGWQYIIKLNALLKMRNTRELGENVRLNDKSANPDGYRKMDVHLAKVIAEEKTLYYAMRLLCQELGIGLDELESGVREMLSQNPKSWDD